MRWDLSWSAGQVQQLRLRDSIGEVRRGEIDGSHSGVHFGERLRVLGRSNISRRYGLVVGPEGDDPAVAYVGPRLHTRIGRTDRATSFAELPGDLDFELGASSMRLMGDPDKGVAGPESHGQPVRVLEDDCVSDSQAKLSGNRRGRIHRGPSTWRIHRKSS
jgi:hypothetical protein